MGVRFAVLTAMVVFTLLMKTIVAPAFAVAGQRPDLLVLMVVGVAVVDGADTGLRLGFLTGLAQDLVAGGDALVGLGAIVMMVVGYAAGQAKPYLASAQQSGAIALAGALSGVATLGYGVLGRLLGVVGASWNQVLVAGLVVALYSAAISPLVLRPVQAVIRQFPPPSAGG